MIDVLIVGAGPVGLALAFQLAVAGRSIRVIEMRPAPATGSRSIVVTPRTLELLRIAGLAPEFERIALRVPRAGAFAGGRSLGSLSFASLESRYDYLAIVPQDTMERIFRDALAARGVAVEYGTALDAFADTDGGVRCRVASSRGEERIDARYVAGCDGVHGTVRARRRAAPNAGRTATYAVFDVETVGDAPDDELTLCCDPAGPLAIVPMGGRRRRVAAAVAHDFDGDATLDLANELLAARGPWNLGATRATWSAVVRIRTHRAPPLAESATVFLAGDAAHAYEPMFSLGCNAGLRDAFALAWKLDFTLAGYATPALLASHVLERDAAARALRRIDDLAVGVAETRAALVRSLRDWWVPGLLERPAVAARAAKRVAGLDAGYARSPIVENAGGRAPDERVRAGDRERRLYDVLGNRYALVTPASASASALDAYAAFAAHYGGAVRIVASDESDAPFVRLVRPDGYLALEMAAPHDPTPALERCGRVLGTHLRRVPRA